MRARPPSPDPGQVIDITTTGRRSGAPRRIEIVSHVIDGRIHISAMLAYRPLIEVTPDLAAA